MDQAKCRGQNPDLWFEENGHYGPANRICRACPVQTQCAEFIQRAERGSCHNQRHGAWACTTPRQRAKAAGAGTARRTLAEKILRLDARGMSPKEIAEFVGVSQRTVFRIKNRHGRGEQELAA
jgi:DNA-binding NarL/FixJ family response regulator